MPVCRLPQKCQANNSVKFKLSCRRSDTVRIVKLPDLKILAIFKTEAKVSFTITVFQSLTAVLPTGGSAKEIFDLGQT